MSVIGKKKPRWAKIFDCSINQISLLKAGYAGEQGEDYEKSSS